MTLALIFVLMEESLCREVTEALDLPLKHGTPGALPRTNKTSLNIHIQILLADLHTFSYGINLGNLLKDQFLKAISMG